MLIPYIKKTDCGDFCQEIRYRKLNFSGKWKITFNKHGDECIYVQHKTIIPFLKLWIPEYHIDFFVARKRNNLY